MQAWRVVDETPVGARGLHADRRRRARLRPPAGRDRGRGGHRRLTARPRRRRRCGPCAALLDPDRERRRDRVERDAVPDAGGDAAAQVDHEADDDRDHGLPDEQLAGSSRAERSWRWLGRCATITRMARVETWGPVPLSARRDRAGVRDRARVAGGARRRAVRLGRGRRGRRRATRRTGRLAEVLAYDRPTGTSHRVDVDLDAGAVVAHVVRDDVQPSLIYEEYAIAGDVVRADPGVARGDGEARHHGLRPDPGRPVGDRQLRAAVGGGAARRARHVAVARHGRRQRLRAPDRGRDRVRRPERAPRRAPRGPRRGADSRRLRPLRRRVEPAVARDAAPARDRPARRAELHARRQRDQLGLLAPRGDDAPGRRPRAARRRVGGRRRGAIGAEARVAGRDDRAVRRRLARPRLQARHGRRRVRLRPVRQLADARL